MFTYRTLAELRDAERKIKRVNAQANVAYGMAPHSSAEQDQIEEITMHRSAKLADAFDDAIFDLENEGIVT